MTPLIPKDFFSGSGGGGASQSPTSKPDDLLSQDYVEIILGLTHGPIKGLVTPDVAGAGPLANYFFGETSLENLATHLPNFADFTITQYPGHDDDPAIARVLGGDASNLNVSVHCLQNIPVVRTTPSSLRKTADFAGLDRLEVRILFNSLVKSDDNGEADETAHLRISYKPSNSTIWTDYNNEADTSVTGKTRGGYVKDFLIPVTPLTDTDYDVRVIKLSPDNGTKEIVDFNWESMQMVVLGKPEYPGLAKMHIYGKASSQFSSLPELSGIFEGIIVKVPVNYNPVTRVYDESNGPWNGAMKDAYTNNPAWILYYLINDPTYGMARYYKNIASNRGDFYNAGKWCDEQVPSGVIGVTQPRFTFNEYLDTQRQGLELLYYVAGAFNSTIYDSGNGVIRLKTDQLTTPKMIFTPENVSKTGFSYTFTDIATRYNDITVQFANPDFNWETDERSASIDATDWITENGRIPFSFTAVGCTDVHEAIRRANDRLLTANTEVTSVSLETTRFGMLAELNDVIYVADPVSGWSTGGRIKSFLNGTIQLRDPIFFEALTLVNITIQTYSGLVQLGVTPPQLGNCYSLNLVSGTWPTNIPDRTVFTVENADNLGMCKPFRVTGITEVEGKADQYQLTAIEINPTKYEDSAAGTVSDPVTYDFTTPGEPIMPPELVLENVNPLVNSDGTLTYRVLASWVRPFQAYTDHYELEHQLVGTSEWVLDKVFGDSTEVKPVSDGKYYNWRLFAVTPVGNRCRNPILVNNFLVTPKNSILEDVRNLTLSQTNKGWQAKWDLPLNTPDLAGTRIKFSNPAAPWESLPDLYLSPSQEQDLPWFTAGTVRVQAKYINTSKNESADAIFIDQAVLAPLNPTLTVETSFGLSQVYLTDPTGTQPLASLQLRQGVDSSTWDTATLKQWSVAGGTRMFTVNPDATNPTKIFVRGVDVAGNLGSIAAVEVPAGAGNVSDLLDAIKGDIDETWITPGLLDHINFGDDSVPDSLASRVDHLESNGGGQFEPWMSFDFTRGVAPANVAFQSQTPSFDNTGTTLTSTGSDPILYCGLTTDQKFAGAAYPIIRARIKRIAGSGWDGSLFYSTESHPEGGAYSKNVHPDPTIGRTDWVDVDWDMTTVSDWMACVSVNYIRLDFGATEADVFEIQYVAIGKEGTGIARAVYHHDITVLADATSAVASDITTIQSKILTTGGVVNSDPYFTRTDTWHASGGFNLTNPSDPISGTSAAVLQDQQFFYSEIYQTSPGKEYKVSTWARKIGDGGGYFYLRLFTSLATTQVTLDNGPYISYVLTTPVETITLPGGNVWAFYSGTVIIPPGAVLMQICVVANYQGTGITQLQDCRIEDISELTATVQTEASTRADETGHLGAQWVTRVALANGVTPVIGGIAIAGTSDADNNPTFDFTIRTNKFAIMPPAGLGADVASEYFAYYTTPTLINNITVQPGMYVKSAFIESVTADKIDTRGLTVKDNAGNVLFGVNTPLAYQYITASQSWLNSNVATEQLINNGGVAIEGNTATKVDQGFNWDCSFKTKSGYKGGCYIAFSPYYNNQPMMVGITTTPDYDNGYQSIDWAIYCEGGGTLFAYGNGANSMGLQGANLGPYIPGDDLSVVYDGHTITYYKNGSVIGGPFTWHTDYAMFGDSSLYAPNVKATNIRFGPLSNRTATFGDNIAGKINAGNASTFIDNAAINYAMIQYILASQIQTTSLSAISANIGFLTNRVNGGQGVEQDANGIRVYDNTGRLRVRMGIW